MKKSLLWIAIAAAFMFSAQAHAGGNKNDKGNDSSHFVSDDHGKSFEDKGNGKDHEGDGPGNSDFGHSHNDGDNGHHYGDGGDSPPYCDPTPPVTPPTTSAVPEAPTWAMMGLAGAALLIRRKRLSLSKT